MKTVPISLVPFLQAALSLLLAVPFVLFLHPSGVCGAVDDHHGGHNTASQVHAAPQADAISLGLPSVNALYVRHSDGALRPRGVTLNPADSLQEAPDAETCFAKCSASPPPGDAAPVRSLQVRPWAGKVWRRAPWHPV